MKIEKFEKESESFNPQKVEEALDEVVKIFNKHKLKVGEIIIAYGNLGYTLGASIGGYKEEGPSIEELKKKYYTDPDIATSLMLQGLNTTTWYETYLEQLSKQSNEEE